jgi:hypothetical protein
MHNVMHVSFTQASVGHKCEVVGVKWVHVTQDEVQWRDFVNRILDILVPQKAVKSLVTLSTRNLLRAFG